MGPRKWTISWKFDSKKWFQSNADNLRLFPLWPQPLPIFFFLPNKAKQVLFLIYDTAYLLEQSSRHGCLYLLEIGCDAGLNKAFNPFFFFFISNVVLLSTVSPVLLCCGKVAVEWKSACSLYGEWIITQSYSMGSQFHFRATKGFKMVILPGKRSK